MGRAWTLLTTVISDYIVTMVTMVELCRSIRKGHVGLGFMHALLLNLRGPIIGHLGVKHFGVQGPCLQVLLAHNAHQFDPVQVLLRCFGHLGAKHLERLECMDPLRFFCVTPLLHEKTWLPDAFVLVVMMCLQI